jgi:hydroxypyruvate isomerase
VTQAQLKVYATFEIENSPNRNNPVYGLINSTFSHDIIKENNNRGAWVCQAEREVSTSDP